jgi:NADPH:quinone reductase-like Zn-dependent oxidoreductase
MESRCGDRRDIRCATEEKKESRKRMYALQLSTFGDPSKVIELVTLPDPEPPKANEVVIGMEYAPVEPIDLLIARGWYGVEPALPAGAGREGVGRVLAVGEGVRHPNIGDRVLAPHPSPTFREQLVVPAATLFVLPPKADPQQLAMASINPSIAALLLSEVVPLSPGDWVIQNAGNSGVGRAVIAFAKERGLRTVSLVRRQELIEELLTVGGNVMLLDGAGVAAQVSEATGHAKIALGVEGVGGEAALSVAGNVAAGGTVVVYSSITGQPAFVSPVDTVYRNVTIRGLWIDNPAVHQSPQFHDALADPVIGRLLQPTSSELIEEEHF